MSISRRLVLSALPLLATPATAATNAALAAAVASPLRSPAFVARDRYRHPAALLTFFGLTPRQSVLEIQPGAGYWLQILAPYLAAQGHYTAALPQWNAREQKQKKTIEALIAAHPQAYGKISTVAMLPGKPVGAANSYDLILSFRNLHDWMRDGTAAAYLSSFHAALKPGGTFGIEDHRWPETKPQDPRALNGYVRADYARNLIEAAGFKFVAATEIGANPKDTKDYPGGVWNLPPTLSAGATDRAKYLAIGESDRWTMKFTK